MAGPFDFNSLGAVRVSPPGEHLINFEPLHYPDAEKDLTNVEPPKMPSWRSYVPHHEIVRDHTAEPIPVGYGDRNRFEGRNETGGASGTKKIAGGKAKQSMKRVAMKQTMKKAANDLLRLSILGCNPAHHIRTMLL